MPRNRWQKHPATRAPKRARGARRKPTNSEAGCRRWPLRATSHAQDPWERWAHERACEGAGLVEPKRQRSSRSSTS
eukprot:11213165-Lingulodinium_polyedra.AAC.1